MISIVIPLYNKEKQIRTTLESVLTQTFQDYEIVIINDGSTDRSIKEVAQVHDPRIRLIHQPNAGVSAARNHGIEEAKGEFIAFLDADDRWEPEYLQTQYELTQLYPECSVFACNYEFVDTKGQVKPTLIRKLPFARAHGVLSNYFEVASTSNPPIWTSAVMVRKESITAISGFPLGIISGEDLLTWARLACRYKIAYNKNASAQFMVEGYEKHEKPKREPDPQNKVGMALKELYKSYKTPYLRHYISHWHRMRASVWMRLGHPCPSVRDALIALWYNPTNIKVLAIAALASLPTTLRMKLLK